MCGVCHVTKDKLCFGGQQSKTVLRQESSAAFKYSIFKMHINISRSEVLPSRSCPRFHDELMSYKHHYLWLYEKKLLTPCDNF